MAANILIVDDEENLQQTLALILRTAGYVDLTAENTIAAHNCLAQNPIDLMILDLKLSDEDGLAFLRQIRKDYAGLPVIILTAFGSMHTAIDALRLDVRDYLLKPVNPAGLLTRIEEILAEKLPRKLHSPELDVKTQRLSNRSEFLMPPINSASLLNHEPPRYLERGHIMVDLKSQRVEIGTKSVSLPPSSFAYLLTLLRHSPDPVTFEDLVHEAQGIKTQNLELRSILRWQIHILRQAIEPDPRHPRYLLTVRNIGYCLVTEV